MTARAQAAADRPDWPQERLAGFARVSELLDWLGLDPAAVGLSAAAARDFPFRVTRSYAQRIRPGDPDDPLLRQVLPVAEELAETAGFSNDPVGDRLSLRGAGLLQKYHGRALLITTSSCAIHCRYCFRRTFPYADHRLGQAQRRQALAALAADPAVHEIILSGGDPLSLPDSYLAELLASLAAMPHLRRIRLHTRLPVVSPERVSPALLEMLGRSSKPVIMVIHCNHPQEIDAAVHTALSELRNRGLTLFNQAVLLRGVNDSVAALAGLSERLFECGVLPYYLHQLDRVAGAAHFEVADARARELMQELGAQLPGYLVPRLVREVAGEPAKRLLPIHVT